MTVFSFSYRSDGSPLARVVAQLEDRWPGIGRCEHLPADADRSWWLPWAPAELRCRPCADTMRARHRAAVCDGCGGHRAAHRELYPAKSICATVDGKARCTVLATLCGPCVSLQAQQEAPRSA